MKKSLFVLAMLAYSSQVWAQDSVPASVSCVDAAGLNSFSLVNNGTSAQVTVSNTFNITNLARQMGVIPADDKTVFKSIQFEVVQEDFFGISPDTQLISSWPTTKTVTFVKDDAASTEVSFSVLGGGGQRGKFQVERIAATDVFGGFSYLKVTLLFRTTLTVRGSVDLFLNLDGIKCQ